MNTTTTTPPIRRLLTFGFAGAIAAVVVNLTIYAISRAADVVFLIETRPDGPGLVGPSQVIRNTVVGLVVGLLAAVIALLLRRPSLRVLQVVGAIFAVATLYMDVDLEGDMTAKALLMSMHLVSGAAYVVSLQLAQSRPRSRLSTRAGHATAPPSPMPM